MNFINRVIIFLKKRTAREFIFVYAGVLINGLSLFLINVILARFVPKDVFGVFSLSVLSLTTVSELSDFGLNTGILKLVPLYIESKDDLKLKTTLKIIWKWRVRISAALTIFGIIFSYPLARYVFNQPQIFGYLAFAFLGVGGVVFLGFLNSFLQSSQQFLYNSVLQILKGLVRLILIGVLVLAGFNNIYLFLSVYIIVPWLLFICNFAALPKKFMETSGEFEKTINKQLGRASFWLTINSAFIIISSKVDQVMVSNLLGLSKVAVFSVAFQFLFFYSVGIQSISSVLVPKTNSFRDKKDLLKYILKSYRILTPIIIFLIPFIYATHFLIPLFFGIKYQESVVLYLILSYATLISLLGLPLTLTMTAFFKLELVALSGFLQLAINILLNWFFINHYGLVGAGISYALSVLFYSLYNLFWSVYLFKTQELISI